jgi:hypothetical protein
MEIVINKDYGGYGISYRARHAIEEANEPDEISGDEFRTSPTLINFIKTYGSEAASDSYANLKVVNIPDNATDWRIEEYDGLESIIYVVDGKMYDLY